MAPPTTILVIDDDKVVRAYMTDCLTDLGHKVLTAPDGFDGVFALRSSPETTLVFLDIQLPFADGTAVLAKIRSLRPDMKVVLITGLSDDELVVRTVSERATVRANGYITKPFDEKNLAACIEMVLVHKRMYLGSSPQLKAMADKSAYRR